MPWPSRYTLVLEGRGPARSAIVGDHRLRRIKCTCDDDNDEVVLMSEPGQFSQTDHCKLVLSWLLCIRGPADVRLRSVRVIARPTSEGRHGYCHKSKTAENVVVRCICRDGRLLKLVGFRPCNLMCNDVVPLLHADSRSAERSNSCESSD